jgi:DNA-binding NarL/FixJ family response regulator
MSFVSLPRRPNKAAEEVAHGRCEGALALLQRRGVPKFFILNRNGEVEFSSPNIVDHEVILRSKRLLASLKDTSEAVKPVYVDASMMLRVVQLDGEMGGYVAVFIEDSGRNSLTVASQLYSLTRRERDVLGYLLKGYGNARIARALFISEGTVGDHVKKIFRKTQTKSRSELVVRVLDRDAGEMR